MNSPRVFAASDVARLAGIFLRAEGEAARFPIAPEAEPPPAYLHAMRVVLVELGFAVDELPRPSPSRAPSSLRAREIAPEEPKRPTDEDVLELFARVLDAKELLRFAGGAKADPVQRDAARAILDRMRDRLRAALASNHNSCGHGDG